MKTLKLFSTILLIVIGFAAQGQRLIGKKKDLTQIMTNIESFSRYYMNAQLDSLVGCYTIDGKVLPNNAKILEGQEELAKFWVISEGVDILQHKIMPEEIRVKGKYAYDYGYYEGKSLIAGKETIYWKGKYVIVWKKVKGEWKIYLDCWNKVRELE